MAEQTSNITQNQLLLRVLSAAIVLALIGSAYWLLEDWGLKFFVLMAVLIGSRELNRVLFGKAELRTKSIIFYIFNLLIFLLSAWRPQLSGLFYSFFFVCFCVCLISLNRRHNNLGELSIYQAKAALGFFYVGLLPSFAYQLITLPSGKFWFISLLCIVFAGDIGAYFVGRKFGNKKIMPLISPKKTVAGALGGLAFSTLAGLLCSQFFPQIMVWKFTILALFTGVIAQYGDFFESLLKRVANLKDSGGLMPGHGGVLDRIDGVLFACPVFLLGAIMLEKVI
ncbi:MAG: phosphatidate cytidylyltransferase [Bdellovibrionales bacterium]